jgi:hypothetical protein
VGANVGVSLVRNVEAPRDLAGQALRRLDVSLHVEVIPQLGLAEREVGRGEQHQPERPRPTQHKSEARYAQRIL